MKVVEVMKQPVVSVAPEAPVAQAARLMLENGISGLPVVDQGYSVVAMLTEGDLLRRAETGTQRHARIGSSS